MRHALLSFCLVIAASIAHPMPAHADGLVLESYVGPRPADASRVMKNLLEELARRDYLSSGAMIQLESRVSKPAQTDAGLPSDFIPQVEKGHKAWIAGNFAESIQILQPLVQKAYENTGAFAQNQQQLRERLFKALMGIAVSQLKMGDTGTAKATFGEILRSFPDQPVSRSVYGPDVADAYEAAKKELGALKRGTLIVNLAGESGPIFINEKYENVSKVSRTDIYPGEYRVFAQPAKGLTRNHRVTIAPGETVTLTIDTGFDLAVQAKSDWVGLAFATAEDRIDNEALYATKLAKVLDKDSVIVVSIEKVNGRAVLVAALIDMVGRKDLRRASIALDPEPSPRTVLGLAKFLTSGEEAEGVQVQVAQKGAGPVGGDGGGAGGGEPVDHPSRGGAWGGWKWLTAGAAVAALGVGTYVLAVYDGSCPSGGEPETCPDADLNEASIAGWATISGGAVMAGVSIFLFVRSGSDDAPARSGFVLPTKGGAMAGYTIRF